MVKAILFRIVPKYAHRYAWVFFLLFYGFFISGNSSLDAWAYAHQVKHTVELFQPHHLLYNLLGWIWVAAGRQLSGVDTLPLLQLMNTFFAAMSLLVLTGILRQRGSDEREIMLWVLFAGSAWGVMRFATDNETYIVPIFFALMASRFFNKFQGSGSLLQLFVSGVFAVVAILFHQVMFFWWFAIAIGLFWDRRLLPVITYLSGALFVPITYALVSCISGFGCTLPDVVRFALHDYLTGSANIAVGFQATLLLPVSLFRTFIQVHGYLPGLISGHLLYRLVLLLSVFLFAFGARSIMAKRKAIGWYGDSFAAVHLIAIFMHLFFSWVSSANAEFLVMLPFLVAILLPSVSVSRKGMTLVVAGMFCWNTVFGLVPYRFYRIGHSAMIATWACRSDSNTFFLLHDPYRVRNELEYREQPCSGHFIDASKLTAEALQDTVRNVLSKGGVIYTDCYRLPRKLSRARLTGNYDRMQGSLECFSASAVDSVITLSGTYYLHRLETSSRPPGWQNFPE